MNARAPRDSRIPAALPEGLLLFSVAFGPLAFGATEPWSLAILESSIFLMLFFTALRSSPDLRQPVYRTILPAVLGIVLLGLLQRLHPATIAAPSSPFPFTASAPGTGRALLLWCAFAALLWSAPQILSDRAALRRFAWAVFVLGAVIACVGIVQRGQGNTAYYGIRAIRHGNPFGPYTNYNHAASMLSMSALMGGGLLLSSVSEFDASERIGKASDKAASLIVTLFLLALIVAGVVLTESRAGRHTLFVAACLGVLGAVRRRDRRWALGFVFGFLLLGVAAYAFSIWSNPHLIGWGFKKPVTSMLYRFSMYRSGAEMWSDFPIFGVGLGALKEAFPPYKEKLLLGIVEHLHSDWLELLVETGLSGFLMVFAGFGLYAGLMVAKWRALGPSSARWLMGGAVAAATAFLAHITIEFSFQIPANAVLFLAVLAWAGAVPAWDSGRPAKPEPASRRLRFALCAAALLLGFQSARPVFAAAPERSKDVLQRGPAR